MLIDNAYPPEPNESDWPEPDDWAEPDWPDPSSDEPIINPDDRDLPEPPHPVNWNTLPAEEAEAEWYALNEWVNWLRTTYGLSASIVPPYWHRHPELVWELSALHLHWLGAYDPQQHGSAPIGWHRDFADARDRLREWVAMCGTKLDRDRPTHQTLWPGEPEPDDARGGEVAITNRDEDFAWFVHQDVEHRSDER
jgi:hypothetical protein